MESQSICLFGTGLFHLANVLKVHARCSMFQNLRFSLRVNNILFYEYTRYCLFIYLSKDTWDASPLWPLWLMFLWTWVYKSLNLAFTSFGYILRSRIVGSYVNSIFNFLRNFHAIFHSYQQSAQGFQLLHILA